MPSLANNLSTGSGGLIGGTVSGGTSGSVLFVNSSGQLAQDNTNFSWDNTNKILAVPALTLATGTLTSSKPAANVTQTWNNAGVTFTAHKINITDSASSNASMYLDCQVGGVSVASITKAGAVITSQLKQEGGAISPNYLRGNLAIGTTTAGTTAAAGVLCLGNGATAPTDSVDRAQLYAVDLSAGNATLGLFVETAVVSESVVSDRTLSIKINGTTYKLCLKA